MPRIIPPCPAAPDIRREQHVVERTYSVKLVTPLFGGGAKAGRVDVQMPIRGSSIRGQLRFWWRFLFGHTFGSVSAMRAREFEVWGSAENPSPVQVTVELDRKTLQYRPFKDARSPKDVYGFNQYGPEAYALFSAKQNEVPQIIKEGLRFKLKLTWPKGGADIAADVDGAVMAWLRFGGIGSRTRRGLGAVHPDDPKRADLALGARLIRASAGSDDPMKEWKYTLDIYQWFRQKSFRNQSPRHSNRPGRSRWPEPDSLRRLTGCTTRDHAQPTVPPATVPSFPKAALGLPIVFKFADGPDDHRNPKADPCRLTLFAKTGEERGQPVGDRMSSPVILRPVWHGDLKKWVAGFLFLPRPEALRVEAYIGAGPATDGRAVSVLNAQIVGQHLGDLDPMNGRDNAIEAFFDYAHNALEQDQRVPPQVIHG